MTRGGRLRIWALAALFFCQLSVSSAQEFAVDEFALHFSEGVHEATSRIVSKPRVRISGDPRKMPVLRSPKHHPEAWRDYFIFGFGKGVRHVEFRDLVFEVSNEMTSVAAMLPDIDPGATLTFENCVFRLAKDAEPPPRDAEDPKPPCAVTIGARVKRCRFVRCTTSNMMLLNEVPRSGYADEIEAQACRFESSHGHLGIKHGKLVADACTFSGSREQAGLELHVSSAQITGCVFSDQGTSIRLSDVAPAFLIGCRFESDSKRPILVERRSHALIADCAFGANQRVSCQSKYGNAVALNCDLQGKNPSCRTARLKPEDLRLITAANPSATGMEEEISFARFLDLAEALPEILYADKIRSMLARKLVSSYGRQDWERLCHLTLIEGTVDEWVLLVGEILEEDPVCAKKLISRDVARVIAQKLERPVFQNHLFPGMLRMMRGPRLPEWGENLLAQEALPSGYRDQIEAIMILNSERDDGIDAWKDRDRIGPWACNALFRRLREGDDPVKLRALAERFPDSPIARHISAEVFQRDYNLGDSTREHLRSLRRSTLNCRYAVCAVGRFGDDQLKKFSDFYGAREAFAFRTMKDLREGGGVLKRAYSESAWDILWVVLPCWEMSKRTHDFFRDFARSMDPDLFLDFVPAYLPCGNGNDLTGYLENLIKAEGEPFEDQFSACYVQGMTYGGYPDPVCADLDHPVCRLSAVLNPSPLAGDPWWCGAVLSSIRGRDALLFIDHGNQSGGDALNIRTFRELPEGSLGGSLVVSSYCHGAGMLNPIEWMLMGRCKVNGFAHACLKKGAIAFYGGLSYNFGPYADAVFARCFYGGETVLDGYREAMDSEILFLGEKYGRSFEEATLSLHNVVYGDPGRRIALPHAAETLNYSCDPGKMTFVLFPASSALPGTGLPWWPRRGFSHTMGYNHVMASMRKAGGREKYKDAYAFRLRLPMAAIPAGLRERGLENLSVECDPSVADDLDVLGYRVLEESDGATDYAQFLFLVRFQWQPSLVVDGIRLSVFVR